MDQVLQADNFVSEVGKPFAGNVHHRLLDDFQSQWLEEEWSQSRQ